MKLLIAMLAMLLVSPAVLAASTDQGAGQPPVAFELAQADQGGGDAAPTKDIDINVQVGEDHSAAGGGEWWTQPIWIAVFIIGGIALLTLLVVASRSSSSPATIVKG